MNDITKQFLQNLGPYFEEKYRWTLPKVDEKRAGTYQDGFLQSLRDLRQYLEPRLGQYRLDSNVVLNLKETWNYFYVMALENDFSFISTSRREKSYGWGFSDVYLFLGEIYTPKYQETAEINEMVFRRHWILEEVVPKVTNKPKIYKKYLHNGLIEIEAVRQVNNIITFQLIWSYLKGEDKYVGSYRISGHTIIGTPFSLMYHNE